MTQTKKVGFVTIIGKPNVGKSTLINQIFKNKISIATPKSNTTRNRINAIYNDEDSQISFIDTPGFLKVKTKLDEKMFEIIRKTITDIDVALFIVPANKEFDLEYIKAIGLLDSSITKFLLINKIDLISKEELLLNLDQFNKLNIFQEIIPISGLKDVNVDLLLKTIKKYLKEDVLYFPEDQIVTYSKQFYASEIIREKILFHFQEEIPHEIFVSISEFEEKKDLIKIRAEIIVSRESLKKIIIGKDGLSLKEIGTKSRKELETYFKTKIFLQTVVKVKKDWKNKESIIKTYY